MLFSCFPFFFLQVYVLYLWATMGFLCFTSPSPMYDVHCFSSVLSRHETTNSCFCIKTISYSHKKKLSATGTIPFLVVNKNRVFFLFSIFFFLQVYVLYLWATMGFLSFTSPLPMYDVHCFSSVLSRHATTNSCFCIITTSYRNHPFQRKPSNLHTRMAPSSCSWIW